MGKESIYMSLDEARTELKKRWNDEALKVKVKNALGNNFFKHWGDKPRSAIFRQLVSADNSLSFFYYCSKYLDTVPTANNYLGDIFVSLNDEKKGLGRLRVTLPGNKNAFIDIINFKENERRKISECKIYDGTDLVGFHETLLKIDSLPIESHDYTEWFKSIGKASDYYYYYLLHFVSHGVLFENFYDEGDSNENKFTHDIVYPAIEKIQSEFNVKPLILRAYPEHQSEEEDFFWWNHSKKVNDYIITFAKNNNLSINLII